MSDEKRISYVVKKIISILLVQSGLVLKSHERDGVLVLLFTLVCTCVRVTYIVGGIDDGSLAH